MDFFKEYGTTQAEIITAIEDAARYILENDNGAAENLPDRLTEAAAVLRRHWNISK